MGSGSDITVGRRFFLACRPAGCICLEKHFDLVPQCLADGMQGSEFPPFGGAFLAVRYPAEATIVGRVTGVAMDLVEPSEGEGRA